MMLSEQLAEFVWSRGSEQIGPEIWEKAKQFFMDALGCAIAGANEPAVKIVLESRRGVAGRPIATVIGGGGERLDAESAAMVNGTAAHIHDFDDGTTAMRGHPSCVMLPTVLACGEECGSTGAEVLCAYIVGIEVCGLLGRGLNPAHYTRGWHNTSTIGIFGATAAAGKLMGLNKKQLISAFGIAASESSGLKGNFGTMCKSLHAGRAAAKGIMAAKLAKLGLEASPAIFEDGHGNFADVTTGGMDRDRIVRLLETEPSCFEEPGLDFKVYPSCGASHNGIDSIMQMKREYGLEPENVKYIRCRVQPVTRDLLRYQTPQTPLQGKFSLQYCLALALQKDVIELSDFEGEQITDPKLLDLIGKIEMVTDETIADGAYFRSDFRWDMVVEVELTDGTVLSSRVEYASGDPHLHLEPGVLERKFLSCACRVMSQMKVEELLQLVKRVDELEHIRILTEAASGKE